MKAVILAGGRGTRFAEETTRIPKPMIKIGGMPILWHIMKIYSMHNITEFVICLGYKGYIIKEYFANYLLHMSDITIDFESGNHIIHSKFAEPWNVTLIDTGENTMVGGRIKRIIPYVRDDEAFCLTYGDGVADINVKAVIDLHKLQRRLATVTAVQPPGRFGSLKTDGNRVLGFQEKPVGDGGWINGGFFVLSPKVSEYIKNDETVWEKEPMEQLSKENNLSVYFHNGFWQPMDTLRDKTQLDKMWETKNAPWKTW